MGLQPPSLHPGQAVPGHWRQGGSEKLIVCLRSRNTREAQRMLPSGGAGAGFSPPPGCCVTLGK